MERMTLKRFYALALIPVLLLCLYSPIPEVRADYSDDFINNLVDYTLSVSGYVKKTTDSVGDAVYGVLKKVDNKYQSIFNAIRDGLSNNTVSVDTGGGVSFTPTITNNIYNILNGGGLGGANAVYLKNNSSMPDPLAFTYINSTAYQDFTNVLNAYSDVLFSYHEGYLYNNNTGGYVPSLCAYDLSNVAFAVVSGYGLDLYDSNFDLVAVDCTYSNYFKNYSGNGNVYNYPVSVRSGSNTNFTMPFYPYGYNTLYNYYAVAGGVNINNICNGASSIITYGNFNSRNEGISLYFSSPSGLIVGNTFNDGVTAYRFMQDPDFIVTNTVNNFPSLTGDQITNNNFDNTYNTFVTNVNNTYNELDLPSFDIDIYRGIAQDQNKLLMDAINDGVENIVSVIQTTSQKLDTIIGLLMHIRDMLKELPSGTGSSSGSAVSVDLSGIISRLDTLISNNVTSDDFDDTMSDLQDALDSISSSASSNNSQLIAINNKLIDLYAALIGNQNSPRDNPNDPESNNYYYGDNYWISEYAETDPPSDFMEDNITAFNNLTNSMKNVVPFCFVVMAVNLISAFSSDPVAPVFTIPFSLERFGYDEEVTIDFSEFTTLHVILTDGFSILFLIGMWFLFFRLLKFVLSFL